MILQVRKPFYFWNLFFLPNIITQYPLIEVSVSWPWYRNDLLVLIGLTIIFSPLSIGSWTYFQKLFDDWILRGTIIIVWILLILNSSYAFFRNNFIIEFGGLHHTLRFLVPTIHLRCRAFLIFGFFVMNNLQSLLAFVAQISSSGLNLYFFTNSWYRSSGVHHSSDLAFFEFLSWCNILFYLFSCCLSSLFTIFDSVVEGIHSLTSLSLSLSWCKTSSSNCIRTLLSFTNYVNKLYLIKIS